MIHNLSQQSSIVHEYMRRLRSVELQSDRSVFRSNIKRVGQVIGYEISKTFDFNTTTLQTPLASMEHSVLSEPPVVITILRAGLSLHDGILEVFQDAESGFIAAYRKHHADDTFEIDAQYTACPPIEGRTIILNDPMLATGQSFLTAMEVLLGYGRPKRVCLAAVIASEEGVEHLSQQMPVPFDLWVAAIDPKLNEQKYIVPGLGDAGDLSFGEKLQR